MNRSNTELTIDPHPSPLHIISILSADTVFCSLAHAIEKLNSSEAKSLNNILESSLSVISASGPFLSPASAVSAVGVSVYLFQTHSHYLFVYVSGEAFLPFYIWIT